MSEDRPVSDKPEAASDENVEIPETGRLRGRRGDAARRGGIRARAPAGSGGSVPGRQAPRKSST